jgi:hypothetical protein
MKFEWLLEDVAGRVTPSGVLVGVLGLRVFGVGIDSWWWLRLGLRSWGWVMALRGRTGGDRSVRCLACEGSYGGGFGAGEQGALECLVDEGLV